MEISRKKFGCILFLIILVCSLVCYQAYVWGTGTKPSPNLYFDDFPTTASFVIKNDGVGNFSAINPYGVDMYWGSNGSDITLAALNASSGAGGGCVYVYPATSGFSGTISVPNATRLVVELGVQGLSYTVASGASCSIADYNSGVLARYVSGSLVFKEDLTNSVISSISWLNCTSVNANNYFLGNQTLAFVEPPSFIIDQSGAYTRAWYGANSTLAFQGTSSSDVVDNTEGNLTSGRTWKETVLVKGNVSSGIFSLDNLIAVPNYTKLQFATKVLLANNANVSMIVNSAPTTLSNTEIEICGGELDGNKANEQAQSGSCISISNTSDVSIHDMTIHDSSFYGVRLAPAGAVADSMLTFKIYGNTFYNNRNDHVVVAGSGTITSNLCLPSVLYNYISLVNATGVTVSANTLINNTSQGGIGIESGSIDNTISANTIVNCEYGVYTYASSGGISNTISSNTIYYTTTVTGSNGIYNLGVNNTITGNTITGQGTGSQMGIYSDTSNNLISGNTISGFLNSSQGYGIRSNNANNDIYANKIINCRYAIALASSSANTDIEGNDFSNNVNILSDAGTGPTTLMIGNSGYNPKGYIANPFSGNNKYLVDAGNNATWSSGVTYTDCESPKSIGFCSIKGHEW